MFATFIAKASCVVSKQKGCLIVTVSAFDVNIVAVVIYN
jgi:hypothetical protein